MNRLRELRRERQLTQKQLAEKLGLSQQVVGYYENEINQPAPDMLIRIADFFNCSIDYLVGREDDFGNITVQAASSAPVLSAEERELLENFRAVDLRNKDRISVYARIRREEYEESKGKRHS